MIKKNAGRGLRAAWATGVLVTGMLGVTGPTLAKDALNIGMGLEPPHLDPTAGAAAAIDEVVYANLFEGLTRIDETGTVRPGLASDW